MKKSIIGKIQIILGGVFLVLAVIGGIFILNLSNQMQLELGFFYSNLLTSNLSNFSLIIEIAGLSCIIVFILSIVLILEGLANTAKK